MIACHVPVGTQTQLCPGRITTVFITRSTVLLNFAMEVKGGFQDNEIIATVEGTVGNYCGNGGNYR